MEVARTGRLGTPYTAPYDVVLSTPTYRLRRYRFEGEAPVSGPLVLVPPLMLTAEIYDISPELSAVAVLQREGVDTWVVDFGAPEQQEGGLDRTLDDHVLAVSDAVDHVRRLTGKDVHLAGYSQGGMFCYQAAAWRQSAGLASVITFGSPVDIHRNLPMAVDARVVERVIDTLRETLIRPLERVRGLPGSLTSTAFKLLSARREVQQIFEFFENLHDRQALERRESRRRFLNGEGFVAWPGPALRTFIDEFIVHNRMISGGFVIEGSTVTLADITCPVLCFVGTKDDLARPPSVRAITRAAPNAEVHLLDLRAGHFGLVVGSQSLAVTWPTVAAWTRWRAGMQVIPAAVAAKSGDVMNAAADREPEEAFEGLQYDVDVLYQFLADAADGVWRGLGTAAQRVTGVVENVRYQLPRLARLRRMTPDEPISLGLALAEQAQRIPQETFFLWKGRAFSYHDADRRVNNVVRGLVKRGVRPGGHVGVLMGNRPSQLSTVAAVSRLGAVAVLLGGDGTRLALADAVRLGEVEWIVTEPEDAMRARAAFDGPVLVLGGGPGPRTLPAGVTDMEAIDPDAVEMPGWYRPNPGVAADLAMIVFSLGGDDQPRAARITNRRWASGAFGIAAAAALGRRDTVYCCLPLHYPTGMLLAVSGALVSGARLALATGFDAEAFWPEVRRSGATVCFYAGEMCRFLLQTPAQPGDRDHPLRLLVGSGMRRDVWTRMLERFGHIGVLEFYGTADGMATLVNLSGVKVGSSGRPLTDHADLALVRFDVSKQTFVRDQAGHLQRAGRDEPGMLIARVDERSILAGYDGFLKPEQTQAKLLRGVFAAEDVWYRTGDLFRVDADGDYWHLDRAVDAMDIQGEWISTRAVEEAVHTLPFVEIAVSYRLDLRPDVAAVGVAIVPRAGFSFDASWAAEQLLLHLGERAVPRFVRVVPTVERSDGYRWLRAGWTAMGVASATDEGGGTLYFLDEERRSYRLVDGRSRARAVRLATAGLSAGLPLANRES